MNKPFKTIKINESLVMRIYRGSTYSPRDLATIGKFYTSAPDDSLEACDWFPRHLLTPIAATAVSLGIDAKVWEDVPYIEQLPFLRKYGVVIPVYHYDERGNTYTTTAPLETLYPPTEYVESWPYDPIRGEVEQEIAGYISMSYKEIRKIWDTTSHQNVVRVKHVLENEVKMHRKWCNEEVYNYVIFDSLGTPIDGGASIYDDEYEDVFKEVLRRYKYDGNEKLTLLS